jgi:SAM-dependent methyltransferase
MEARETFNTVAALYDAQRVGYPDALFDDLANVLHFEPTHRVLEIGCGSGQATIGFGARGLDVVAIDPGAALVDIARQKFKELPNVRFEVASFENWPIGGRSFHLVAAAQSWHWVRPDIAFEKASRALTSNGYLAIFGHTPCWPSKLSGVLEPVYRKFAPELWGPPSENWYLPEGPIPSLYVASGCFGNVTHRRYTWRRQYSPQSLADYLGTRSDHLRLTPERRDKLLSAVASRLSRDVNVGWETNLYLAPVLSTQPIKQKP